MNFQQPFQPTYNRYAANYTPVYQQQQYQQPAFSPAPPAYQQDGTIPARFISAREEAVASTVFPGMPYIFYNSAQKVAYVKSVDAQTGEVEFITLAKIPTQDQAPPVHDYVTVDMFKAYQTEIEKRLESLQTPQKKGKAVNDDV